MFRKFRLLSFATMTGELVIDGVRLEVRAIPSRTPNTPTLVLLHEGLGCAAMWRDFPERLAARTGFRVVAYSRRGFGGSEAASGPLSLDYHRTEALDVLPKVLDAAGIERAVLIGHSDGGTIALLFAESDQGKRIDGVVTLATHVFNDDVTVNGILEAKAAYESGRLRDKLARYHGPQTDHVFGSWNEVWLRPEFRRWSIERHLPAIALPLLVIQGQDDHYGTAAQVEAIARQVSGPCETMILPDCGHHPHLEQAAQTLDAIAGFIQGLGTSRSRPR